MIINKNQREKKDEENGLKLHSLFNNQRGGGDGHTLRGGERAS